MCRWLRSNYLCSITWARWTKAFLVPFSFRRHEDHSLFYQEFTNFAVFCLVLAVLVLPDTCVNCWLGRIASACGRVQGNCGGLGSGTRHLGRLHCSVTCSKYYNNTRNSNNNLHAHDTNTFHPDTGYTLHSYTAQGCWCWFISIFPFPNSICCLGHNWGCDVGLGWALYTRGGNMNKGHELLLSRVKSPQSKYN